jgi:hypothetical protein
MSEAARIAAQLTAQYGEDAAVIATLRAAEVAAQGIPRRWRTGTR